MMRDLREVLHSVGKFSFIGIVSCLLLVMLTALLGFTRSFNDQQLEFKSIFSMDYDHVAALPIFSTDYLSILLQGAAAVYFSFLNHQFVFPLIGHLQ
jgi:hypothetical protein